MDVGHILQFMEKIGCRQVSVGSRAVRAVCPFEYRHSHGIDKHPSFAIMSSEGESTFKCYSPNCFKGGRLERLVALLDKSGRFNSRVLKDMNAFILRHDRVSIAELMRRAETSSQDRKKTVEVAGIPVSSISPVANTPAAQGYIDLPVLDESHLTEFFDDLSDRARRFLHRRGMSDKTIAEWGLRWHRRASRVAIPVRDSKKRLVGISGRTIIPDRHPKYLHSKGFRRDYYLFGEDKITQSGPAYLVEGQFDVTALWQYGYRNVVAVLGSYLTKFQEEKIARFFSDVVIVMDGDEAGLEAADRISRALRLRLKTVQVAELPDGKDPGSLTRDEAIVALGPPTR